MAFMSAMGWGLGAKPQDPTKNLDVQSSLTGLKAPATTPAETSQAGNFYRTLLGGSQTETASMLAPEVSTITKQYDKAAQAAAELGPRGGGRTAQMASLPFQKLQAYGDLLAKLKAGAPTGLQQIGAQQQQAMTARRGQDVSTLGALMSGATSYAQIQQAEREARSKAWTEFGKSIGGALMAE